MRWRWRDRVVNWLINRLVDWEVQQSIREWRKAEDWTKEIVGRDE